MKMTLIWVLMHIVGPITLLTILVGLLSKVTKALFPEGHQRAVTGFGAKIAASLTGVWHFFFLTADERTRLDTHDTTGIDPGVAASPAAVSEDTVDQGAPLDDSEIPETLLNSFASMYADSEPSEPITT